MLEILPVLPKTKISPYPPTRRSGQLLPLVSDVMPMTSSVGEGWRHTHLLPSLFSSEIPLRVRVACGEEGGKLYDNIFRVIKIDIT